MLPQTNLQLYRLMMAGRANNESLAQARAAYDLARRLFVGYYRPSHKPFLCHLVGVAGALAAWGQESDVVAAGLLHSAYLYGNFGDGARGVTAAKRRAVRNRVGASAEAYVERYTRAEWKSPLTHSVADSQRGTVDGTLVLMKLADLCDDCVDAGTRFSPAKSLEFGLPDDLESRRIMLELLNLLAGGEARAHLAAVFAECDGAAPPAGLLSPDSSHHVVTPGVDELRRFRIRLRLRRFAGGLTGKRSA